LNAYLSLPRSLNSVEIDSLNKSEFRTEQSKKPKLFHRILDAQNSVSIQSSQFPSLTQPDSLLISGNHSDSFLEFPWTTINTSFNLSQNNSADPRSFQPFDLQSKSVTTAGPTDISNISSFAKVFGKKDLNSGFKSKKFSEYDKNNSFQNKLAKDNSKCGYKQSSVNVKSKTTKSYPTRSKKATELCQSQASNYNPQKVNIR
jgi:hypothetical protein